MLIYLDTVIVIYAVEGDPPFQQRALARLGAARAVGASFAVSDLTYLECFIKPFKVGDMGLLANFKQFLTGSRMHKLPITAAAYERAARIRANLKYKLGDILHLAAAVEGNCDRFLTNDLRLGRYTDITIEVLP